MSKLGKEIFIGFIPVFLIFLMFVGVNIMPVLFTGLLAFTVYYMIRSRAGAGMNTSNERTTKGRTP
jgi:hypothetical protein